MLVSGVLTCTMFYGLFAPQAALESMFGASFNGTLENIVIRSWSALVGLIGAILIFGFFSQKYRVFSISVATFSKIVFVSLVLLYGQEFLGKAATVIVMDCVVIFLSGIYLFAVCIQRQRPDKAIKNRPREVVSWTRHARLLLGPYASTRK
jgi:hypothetical protein